LTLTMLSAFSEYERAKFIERTTRGRLHRLRMGEMSSNGHRIYGYHYVKKTPTAPAALVINEERAVCLISGPLRWKKIIEIILINRSMGDVYKLVHQATA
jgi:DNA invertase Pin-like site-specific DNA recombinase